MIDERIAAKAEERWNAKEEAQQAELELLAKQEEEEIKRQIQSEIKRPAPLSFNGLVAKKRKRPDLENIFVDDSFVHNASTKPQHSPKKPKYSTNVTESAKPNAESKPERFAPAPRAPRNKTNGGWKEQEVIDTRKSEWYLNTNVNNQKFNRGDLQTIAYIKTLITNCTIL